MSTKCVHFTGILPWNLPFSVPALNKQYPDLNWTTQKWTWWISLPSKLSRIMNLNPPKSIANISFILSSEYLQWKNNASPRNVVTDDDVVVDERYLTLETPCHRIPTKFRLQTCENSAWWMLVFNHVWPHSRPTRNWREVWMVTIIHGSFGLLYIIAGKSKALFGSCPLRLSSKKNEEHTKIL